MNGGVGMFLANKASASKPVNRGSRKSDKMTSNCVAVERRFKFCASGHTFQLGFQRILLKQRPNQFGKIRIVFEMKNVQGFSSSVAPTRVVGA